MNAPAAPVVRECVEGYVFRSGHVEVLVLRRPPARGEIWVPVSGKVERTDHDFETALRRELEEETGLANPLRVLPLDWHVPFRADNGETWRLHAFGVEVGRDFRPRLSAEHVAFEWLRPEAAIARLHYPDNQEAVRRLVDRIAGDAPKV